MSRTRHGSERRRRRKARHASRRHIRCRRSRSTGSHKSNHRLAPRCRRRRPRWSRSTDRRSEAAGTSDDTHRRRSRCLPHHRIARTATRRGCRHRNREPCSWPDTRFRRPHRRHRTARPWRHRQNRCRTFRATCNRHCSRRCRHQVSVVTRLVRVGDPIATSPGLTGGAARRINGVGVRRTVVALLEPIRIDHTVATHRRSAARLATVAGHEVAVIARLALDDIDKSVATHLVRQAVRAAPIPVEPVAVVADLEGVDRSVAAACRQAHTIETGTVRHTRVCAGGLLVFALALRDLRRRRAASVRVIANVPCGTHHTVHAGHGGRLKTRGGQEAEPTRSAGPHDKVQNAAHRDEDTSEARTRARVSPDRRIRSVRDTGAGRLGHRAARHG